MYRKLISAAVLALAIGFSPTLLAGQAKKTEADQKAGKQVDRGKAWHNKDWKKAGVTLPMRTSRTGQAVRTVEYTPPTSRQTRYTATRPAGSYRFSLTDRQARYDYFSAHYGSQHRNQIRKNVATQPATGILGYVPPDNAHNPFIYRRGD